MFYEICRQDDDLPNEPWVGFVKHPIYRRGNLNNSRCKLYIYRPLSPGPRLDSYSLHLPWFRTSSANVNQRLLVDGQRHEGVCDVTQDKIFETVR